MKRFFLFIFLTGAAWAQPLTVIQSFGRPPPPKFSTPITVDYLLDLNQGPAVASVLNASGSGVNDIMLNSRGGSNLTASVSPSPLTTFKVAATCPALRNPVNIGGTTYAGSSTLMQTYDMAVSGQEITLTFGVTKPTALSFGFFWQTSMGSPSQSFARYDIVQAHIQSTGNDSYVSYADRNAATTSQGTHAISMETTRDKISQGGVSLFALTANTWYWITGKVLPGNYSIVQVYNSSTWALLDTQMRASDPGTNIASISFGAASSGTNAGFTHSFANLIMDYTNANFPLLP